jgi:hypothetical protein
VTRIMYPRRSAPCQHKCKGNHKCGCDGNQEHTLHICRDERCECHTAAGYHMEQVYDRNGARLYVPMGARLVARGTR